MKIDLHVHTNKSPCSDVTLEDAIRTAVNNDIRGIAVCDHDIPFSCENLREIEEKLSININPANRCENEFYLIDGMEISTPLGHVLALFTGAEIIKNHEDPFDEIKKSDGISVIAHPFQHSFDTEKRVTELEPFLKKADLIECASGRANYKNKNANRQAEETADNFNIGKSAGSDAHFVEEIGNAYLEITDDFIGIDGLKNAIKNAGSRYYNNCKRITVAKSQLVKSRKERKVNLKSLLFYFYCLILDVGDKLCQK